MTGTTTISHHQHGPRPEDELVPSSWQISGPINLAGDIGVAGLDQVSSMQQFATKYSVNGFTNLADTDGSVWANFGVTQQPAFAFIRPDGSISVVKGGLSEPDLNQRVAALATT